MNDDNFNAASVAATIERAVSAGNDSLVERFSAMLAQNREVPRTPSPPASGGDAPYAPHREAELARRAAQEMRDADLTGMPLRSMQTDERRMRGGQARLDPRMAHIQRILVPGRDLTQADCDAMRGFLSSEASNSQVPPSFSFASAVASGAQQLQTSQSQDLFGNLQAFGLAAVTGEKLILHSFSALLKEMCAKAIKTNSLRTYADLCKLFRKGQFLTPRAMAEDEDRWWALFWHKSSMELLYTTEDFTVALAYHNKVMERWEAGFLNPNTYTDSQEWHRGDIENCLDQIAYRYSHSTQAKTDAKTASKEHGSAFSQDSTNTYCANHQQWYPASSEHSTATCKKAPSDKGKGKGPYRPPARPG